MAKEARKEPSRPTRKPAPRAKNVDAEGDVLANIAAMPAQDRVLAERLHALLKAGAPALTPRLWYSMPAYSAGDKLICFFQSAHRFKARYATLGFMHAANLDDGAMWPVSFALTHLNAAEEAKIVALVKKAMS